METVEWKFDLKKMHAVISQANYINKQMYINTVWWK